MAGPVKRAGSFRKYRGYPKLPDFDIPSPEVFTLDNGLKVFLMEDRELPLIGGKWGWDLFIDTPLNGEPDGAEVTLRRAKGWYARRFGEHWRLKLTADYTRGGGLELSDNYFTYSGWDRTLLTLGIADPAFSLESVSSSSALTFMERGLVVDALAES